MANPDSRKDQMAAGAQVRREVLGQSHVGNRSSTPDRFQEEFTKYTEEHCWGNVWVRPGLGRKTRSMLNLAMLAALGRWHEFEVHVRGAINNGVSETETIEIILQAGVYAGIPVAAEGFRRAGEIFKANTIKTVTENES